MNAYAQKNAQGKWEVWQVTQATHFVTVEDEGGANKIVKMLRAVDGGKVVKASSATPAKGGKGKGGGKPGRPKGYSPKKAREAAQAQEVQGDQQQQQVGGTEPDKTEEPPAQPAEQFAGIKEAAGEQHDDEAVHAHAEEEEEGTQAQEPQATPVAAVAASAAKPSAGGMTLDENALKEIIGT